MHFDEVEGGDFRIYAEAHESKLGNRYTAFVKRMREPTRAMPTFSRG
jgi:hypothetical protein